MTGARCSSRLEAGLLKVPAGWPKKLDWMPSCFPACWSKTKSDDRSRKAVPGSVEGSSFWQSAEARFFETSRDEIIQELWFQRAAHKVKQPFVLREICDPGDGGNLKIPEMAGDEENAFALRVRAGRRLHVLHPDPRFPARIRHEREARKLDQKARVVSIIRLR
jgi:hypothetical protein